MKTGFRLMQFLLACGMLAFVTVFVTVVMRVDFERCKSASWPEIPCRVVDSSVERKAIDDYRFAASFKYEANGRTNSSSSVNTPESMEYKFERIEKRLPLLRKYAKGATATCRVNPDCPAQAVLLVDSGDLKDLLIPLLVLGFFAVVGLAVAGLSFGGVRKKLSEKLNPGVLIGSGLGLIFCVFGWSGVVANVGDVFSFQTYEETTGRVLAKGVVSHQSHGKRGTRTVYAPRIAFAYTVDGTAYESDRYRSSDFLSSDSSESRRIVRNYQVGETIKVWYDTSAPSRAQIVKPGSDVIEFVPLALFGFFALCGMFLLAFLLRSVVKAWIASRRKGEVSSPLYGVRLRRKQGADFWFLVVFATIWNLFSWLLVCVFIISPWPHVSLGAITVLIFPIVGLFFVAKVIRRGVSHFLGTHVALTMTTSGLSEGTPVRLDYAFDGTAKVTRLLFAVGQWNEEVTRSKDYGSPESLVEVVSLEHPSPMGSVEFRFPAVLKAKAVTSEIRVTLMRTGKKKTVDIFAIP